MSSKQNFQAIAVLVIIALLGLNAYQYYVNNKLTGNYQVQKSEMVELQKVQEELDQDYQTALASLEEMRSNNDQLNALIDSQKEELKSQKDRINGLIWTSKELDKAKAEIKNLNANVAKYLADIQQLKDENRILSSDNEQLTIRVEEESQAKEAAIQERDELSSKTESLSQENLVLGTKVDIAKAIKVNFIDVKGYVIKDNGKVKEQKNAKSVEMLRTCFITETNLVATPGEKRFYIRFINPAGETVAVEDAGSGVLTNKADNTQVRYTTSANISYNNEDTNACIDWSLPIKLNKGNYKVEMYNNGFLVGKGDFKLK